MNDVMNYCTGQIFCPECSARSFHLICGQGYRHAVCAVCGWHTGVTDKDERTIERAMDALRRARTRWNDEENKQKEGHQDEGQGNTESA